jgi:hypothetical protein
MGFGGHNTGDLERVVHNLLVIVHKSSRQYKGPVISISLYLLSTPGWQAVCVTDANMKRAVTSCQHTLDTSFFCARIQALEPRWDKFLNVSDDCVGVWCVPSPTYIQCTHQSQNEVLGIGMFVTSVFETVRTIDTKPCSVIAQENKP